MTSPSSQLKLAERIDLLIKEGDALAANRDGQAVETGQFNKWRSQCLALLKGSLGPAHIYTTSFTEQVGTHNFWWAVSTGVGILRGLSEDIRAGHLDGLVSLLRAEVFTDFLDMAHHLLENGYKDPAASLIGAVLEDFLRQIAIGGGLSLKAREDLSSLNSKCAQKGLYTRLRQKQIDVWIAVRNHADHGRFSEYSSSTVLDMLQGVTGFMADYEPSRAS